MPPWRREFFDSDTRHIDPGALNAKLSPDRTLLENEEEDGEEGRCICSRILPKTAQPTTCNAVSLSSGRPNTRVEKNASCVAITKSDLNFSFYFHLDNYYVIYALHLYSLHENSEYMNCAFCVLRTWQPNSMKSMPPWTALQSCVFLKRCTDRIGCGYGWNKCRCIIAEQNILFVILELTEKFENIFDCSTASESLRQRQECMRQICKSISGTAATHKHASGRSWIVNAIGQCRSVDWLTCCFAHEFIVGAIGQRAQFTLSNNSQVGIFYG